MVRLVDHRDLNAVECGGLAVEQVYQPAGRRDHDVDTPPHPLDLAPDRHPAVDRGDSHAERLAERREHIGDLTGEFAGRHENQGPGRFLPPPGWRGREPGQHRQAEGQRLARAGLRAAEDVAAGQCVRKRAGLDCKRRVDAAHRQRGDQPVGEAELAESRFRRRRGRRGGSQGTVEFGVRPIGRSGRPAVGDRPCRPRGAGGPGRAGGPARPGRFGGPGRVLPCWRAATPGVVGHERRPSPSVARGPRRAQRCQRQRWPGAHREADCSHKRPRGLLARGSSGPKRATIEHNSNSTRVVPPGGGRPGDRSIRPSGQVQGAEVPVRP